VCSLIPFGESEREDGNKQFSVCSRNMRAFPFAAVDAVVVAGLMMSLCNNIACSMMMILLLLLFCSITSTMTCETFKHYHRICFRINKLFGAMRLLMFMAGGRIKLIRDS
jgi:branched-subunit amino acid transport protein AzlD